MPEHGKALAVIVPNITQDTETGIGKWGHQEIVDILKIGMLPDGDFTGVPWPRSRKIWPS